jgi:hypothetical protein
MELLAALLGDAAELGPLVIADSLEPANSACGQMEAMRGPRTSKSNAQRILSLMGRTAAELTSRTAGDKPPLEEYACNVTWCLNFSWLFRDHCLRNM